MKNMFLAFFLILFFTTRLCAEIVVISNNYILGGIDRQTGRIIIQTIEGDATTSLDNNKYLLYSKVPPTSLIAIFVNGETVIYGSQKGRWLRKPYVNGDKVTSAWQYKNLSALLELKPVHNPSTGFPDNILIYCSVMNNANKLKVGVAIILDILLGETEPRFFNISEKGIFSNEMQLEKDDIPFYWYTMDDIDNQTMRVQGILYKYGAIKPDRIVFATWDRVSELWGLEINSGYDFRRRGTTQYDGAVGIFYDPRELNNGEVLEAATIYGIMGSNVLTEEDFLLTLNIPKEPKELPIPIVGMLVNRSSEEIEKLSLDITLPEGFYLTDGLKTVETSKIPPGGSFQTKWVMSAEAAGGNFLVKVKASITQKKQQKTMEVVDSFYANFYKKSEDGFTGKQKTAEDGYKKEISKRTDLVEKDQKLKKIEKLLDEIDQIYENWIEIYKTIFQDKNYTREQIDRALLEINKEIEYFNRIISNEIK